jgi:hypothetical protein
MGLGGMDLVNAWPLGGGERTVGRVGGRGDGGQAFGVSGAKGLVSENWVWTGVY